MLNVEIFKLTRHGNDPYYIKEIINMNERNMNERNMNERNIKKIQ